MHGVWHTAVLEHNADLGAQLRVCLQRVFSEQAHGTAGGFEQTLGAGEGRGFTGTVSSEQDDHLTGEDAQVDLVDGAVEPAGGEPFGVLGAEGA